MAFVGSGVLIGMGVVFKTFLETYPWGRVLLRVVGIRSANGIVTMEARSLMVYVAISS